MVGIFNCMDYDVWDAISFQDLYHFASIDGVESFLKPMKVTTAERFLSSIPSMILLNARVCSVVDLFSLKPH